MAVRAPMCGLQDPSFEVDDNNLFFSLQHPHQQTQFLLHQNTQNFGIIDSNQGVSSSSSSCNTFPFMAFYHSLDAQFELQRQEIDCILQLQNERLRLALQEQRKQELAILLSNIESRTLGLIRQKEDDLAQATMRTMELQECLKKAEMESVTWQSQARANEAMVIDLNNTLEQVKERLILVSNRAEDAESFCGSCERSGGGEDRRQEEVKKSNKKMSCKSCNSRTSCVLFLPCRHLCSCKYCEAFLGSCPVCDSVKEDSMEVFLV